MMILAALTLAAAVIGLTTLAAGRRASEDSVAASAEALLSSGRWKEAAWRFEDAAKQAAARYGESNWRVVAASSGRAVAFLLLGSVDAAAPLVERARACIDQYDALPDATLGWAWIAVAMYDAKRGEHHDALKLIVRARRTRDVVVWQARTSSRPSRRGSDSRSARRTRRCVCWRG
jgi:hypothetical protein